MKTAHAADWIAERCVKPAHEHFRNTAEHAVRQAGLATVSVAVFYRGEASGDPARTAALKRAIAEHGIASESVDDLGGALGASRGGRIHILNKLSPATELTTLVHEFAYEFLHRADDRPASRDVRELDA